MAEKVTVELDQIMVALINAQDDARKALKMNVDFLTARVQSLHNENERLRAELAATQESSVVPLPDNIDTTDAVVMTTAVSADTANE